MNQPGIHIEGLDRLLRKLGPALVREPLRRFLERGAIVVQGHARERAPVDTGLLRSDIAYELDPADVPSWARIGPNVFYAPYQEYGTGLLAEGPGAAGGRHWPPGEALSAWAERHGGNGFAVAAAIGRRGGLRPKRFLRGGLQDSLAEIRTLLGRLGRDLAAAWEKR